MADIKDKILDDLKEQEKIYYRETEDEFEELYIEEHDKYIRAEVIDDYMNRLCDKCMQTPNECNELECPFYSDGCDIVKIAEQLKEIK